MVKNIFLAIALLFLSVSGGLCQESPIQPTIKSDNGTKDQLFNKIFPHLPNGWRCIEAPYGLNIFREKVVYTYNPISRPTMKVADWEIAPHAYAIIIYFKDVVSKDGFNNAQQKNKKIIEAINTFEEKMRHFAGKGDFCPKTNEDKKLYNEYKKLLTNISYTELPDGFDKKQSYFISIGLYRHAEGPYFAFFDKAEQLECKDVLRLILKSMDTYIENKEKLLDSIFYGQGEKDFYRYRLRQIK